ncbi:MAG: response regulator transcription factor, partial [Acidobacteria bacterium]|nr:response regulator transcription factor [Acidobacteriota bacterium]
MRSRHQLANRAISVLVADTNVMAARFLCMELGARPEFHVVGAASSAAQLVNMVERREVRIVLVSASLLELKAGDGAILAELLQRFSSLRGIVMIDHPDRALVMQAFRAGARGVFNRFECQVDSLCKCILCVDGGQVWANAEQLNWRLDAVVESPPRPIVSPGAWSCSARARMKWSGWPPPG